MKSEIVKPAKAVLLAAVFATLINTANGQQHVIADKDNTHPSNHNNNMQ